MKNIYIYQNPLKMQEIIIYKVNNSKYIDLFSENNYYNYTLERIIYNQQKCILKKNMTRFIVKVL